MRDVMRERDEAREQLQQAHSEGENLHAKWRETEARLQQACSRLASRAKGRKRGAA